jgi:hypothetical protein
MTRACARSVINMHERHIIIMPCVRKGGGMRRHISTRARRGRKLNVCLHKKETIKVHTAAPYIRTVGSNVHTQRIRVMRRERRQIASIYFDGTMLRQNDQLLSPALGGMHYILRS